MPTEANSIIEFLSSPTFGTIQIIILSYLGLLWLAIIIWVTRDAINRSNSIIFQAIAILLNIAIPFLGVLLYLIIRPSKTALESYYEELEHNMIEGTATENKNACDKCLTPVDKEFGFCPNCGTKLKKTCTKCRKAFPNIWNICPFCGKEFKDTKEDVKKHQKSPTKK